VRSCLAVPCLALIFFHHYPFLICCPSRPWTNAKLGTISAGRAFREEPWRNAWIGSKGMGSLPAGLAAGLSVKQNTWVSRVEWIEASGMWSVSRRGAGSQNLQEQFDYLVIAHNGKCADQLMCKAGVPEVHASLRVKFGPKLSSPRQPLMQLTSLWVCMLVLRRTTFGSEVGFDAAVIEQHPVLGHITDNTSKGLNSKLLSEKYICLTLVSTPEFGAAHKVSQENVPESKRKEVSKLMVLALAEVLQMKKSPVESSVESVHLQLWGAAVPLNTASHPEQYIFDAENKVGVAGDWLVTPNIRGAAISGEALARRLCEDMDNKERPPKSVGIPCRFASASGCSALGVSPGEQRDAKGVGSKSIFEKTVVHADIDHLPASSSAPSKNASKTANIDAELDALATKLKQLPMGNETLNARRRLKKKMAVLKAKQENST
jgi:predicted NAD/FAD-dependent oxidoreductase